MAKFSLDSKSFQELVPKIEAAGGEAQKAADSALKAVHGLITPRLKSGISRHVQTGETKASLLRSPDVRWKSPLEASVHVGFGIGNGGLPSIFLMWGTPKMSPDIEFRNAAFGPKVKREAAKAQREALEKVLKRLEG